MVMLTDFSSFLSIYLTIGSIGVGSTKPNEREDGEDERSEELEDDAWMKLLDSDGDGILSLKSWKEVTTMKANKNSLALALREITRQAWSECLLFINTFLI